MTVGEISHQMTSTSTKAEASTHESTIKEEMHSGTGEASDDCVLTEDETGPQECVTKLKRKKHVAGLLAHLGALQEELSANRA